MSIDKELKKDGITIVSTIDTLKVNSIAKSISEKICDAFPNFSLDQNAIFSKLSRLNMYMADMPNGLAEANYLYKNSSVYFNSKISEEDLEEFAIHECIHHLQEVKDNKNNIIKMGFCDFTDSNLPGLGLNEAAVQLMAAKTSKIPKEYVKYFGIGFYTTSPSYYPLECCLVNQLAYLVGDDILFDSTLFSNNNFEETLSKIISKKVFLQIRNSIDELLELEGEIIKNNNKILEIDYRAKKIDNLVEKINELKNELSLLFIQTQNLIMTSYFNATFDHITNFEEVELYRRKLYNFKNYAGSTDNYTFINTYYVSKMEELEEKYTALENGVIFEKPEFSLTVQKTSFFSKLFRAIKKLIYSKNYETQNLDID